MIVPFPSKWRRTEPRHAEVPEDLPSCNEETVSCGFRAKTCFPWPQRWSEKELSKHMPEYGAVYSRYTRLDYAITQHAATSPSMPKFWLNPSNQEPRIISLEGFRAFLSTCKSHSKISWFFHVRHGVATMAATVDGRNPAPPNMYETL